MFDRRPGSRRFLFGLVLASVALLLCAAPNAYADDPDTWRKVFLEPGAGVGDFKGVVDGVIADRGEDEANELLVETVRPLLLFDGPLKGSPDNQRRVVRFVILRLLEPVKSVYRTDPILLADEIVDRLAGEKDDALVREIRAEIGRDSKTGRQPAWERLLAHAAKLLARTDADAPSAKRVENAIWLLGQGASDGGSMAAMLAIAAIADNVQRRAGSDTTLRAVPEAIYLNALESLVWHRFPRLSDANSWLNKQQDVLVEDRSRWSDDQLSADHAFQELIRRLARRPSADRVFAIEYGKNAIAYATKPEDLSPRFLADCPYPELREAALRRAATLSPDATRPWVDLIVNVLGQETSSVEPLLGILSLPPYQQVSEHSGLIVDAIVSRLRDRARADSVDDRKRLVESLTVLGSITHIQSALDDLRQVVVAGGAADQEEVYAALLRKAGEVADARVEFVVSHYFPIADRRPTDVIRRTVAEALGQKGIRDNPEEAVIAAQVLRLILSGAEEVSGELRTMGVPEAVTAETSSGVRSLALRNLEHYPDIDTIDMLKRVVLAVNEAESELALDTLGRILDKHGEANAVRALVDILGAADPAPTDAVFVKTIDALAKLPADADASLTSDVATAIVGLIGNQERTGAVRQAAAGAAARRALPNALPAVIASWLDVKEAEWYEALKVLVEALSADDAGTNDNLVAGQLRQLGEGSDSGFEKAVELLGERFEATGRYPYAFSRGMVFEHRAELGETPANQKKKYLEDAIDSFQSASRADDLPKVHRFVTFNSLYAANLKRASLGDEAEFLLRALETAAASGEMALAQTAAGEGGVVAKLDRHEDLDDAQKQRKTAAEDTVNQLKGG